MTTTRRENIGEEKLTDRQQVHNARKRQRDHEVRPTPMAEVARADR